MLYTLQNLKEIILEEFTYQFINAYPISINSMPVSYDASQLLKCTVSFTYSRYVITRPRTLYDNLLTNQISKSEKMNFVLDLRHPESRNRS
jgi:hypothetical protein